MLFSFLQEKEYEKCGAEEMGAFFLYVRTDRMAAPATLLTYYTRFRTFFDFLTQEEVLSCSPMAEMKKPICRDSEVQPFTQSDINALLHACSQSAEPERNKAIVLFLYDTGVRASELCGLKRKDVDLLQQQATVFGKGGKKRTVPFGKSSLRALMQYLRFEGG
jgi:integrase/recombinase XerC